MSGTVLDGKMYLCTDPSKPFPPLPVHVQQTPRHKVRYSQVPGVCQKVPFNVHDNHKHDTQRA